MKTTLVFTPGGRGRCLYTEAVDLARLGSMSIERATRIEFDNVLGEWCVYPPDSNQRLHSHASRQECVAWEHAYIERLEDDRHDRTEGETLMRLAEIMSAAASAYPDGVLHRYWDAENERVLRNSAGGDSLALFIVSELCDTFDPDASDGEQIATAVNALRMAQSDLQAVMDALKKLED